MSADGSKLAALVTGGPIYISTNSGTTWTTSSTAYVSQVACSVDGSLLVAAGGPIYISTNWGTSWVATSAPNLGWASIACSADAAKMVALSYAGYLGPPSSIYTSTNSGGGWAEAAAPTYTPWRAVSCSADGRQMVAVARGEYVAAAGLIYHSLDYGSTWAVGNLGYHPWTSVCSSADGYTLASAAWDGIWVSTNAGLAWTNFGLSWLYAVASSADGRKLVVASNYGNLYGPAFIYTSTNAGSTWMLTTALSNAVASLCSSADGNRLLAVTDGCGIYTLQTTPTPVLSITPSAGSLLISWIVPSLPFVLQENAELTTPNWTDVTATPILNFTNLHHEVNVPLSSTRRFYRLRSL